MVLRTSNGPIDAAAKRVRNPRGGGGQLRDDLIGAAGRLLDAGGEDALTMRAVTREIGAAPQSIYLHFKDKEQLLWVVLRDRFAELAKAGDEAEIHAGADPGTRLRARCLSLCGYGLAHPRRYQLLFIRAAPVQHQLALDELPGAVTFRALQTTVRRYLEAGSRPAGDAFTITTDLLATLHGAVLLRTNMPSFPWPPIEHVIDQAVTAIDAAIGTSSLHEPGTRMPRQ